MGRGNEQLTTGSRSRKSCRKKEAGSRSHEAVGTIKQREGAEHLVSAKDNMQIDRDGVIVMVNTQVESYGDV